MLNMTFLKKDIWKDLCTWVSTAILIYLLDVSVNWAKQILSLPQATEVALGFVELLRTVLKDDISKMKIYRDIMLT